MRSARPPQSSACAIAPLAALAAMAIRCCSGVALLSRPSEPMTSDPSVHARGHSSADSELPLWRGSGHSETPIRPVTSTWCVILAVLASELGVAPPRAKAMPHWSDALPCTSCDDFWMNGGLTGRKQRAPIVALFSRTVGPRRSRCSGGAIGKLLEGAASTERLPRVALNSSGSEITPVPTIPLPCRLLQHRR